MVEIRITTTPGYRLSGGSGLFRVDSKRATDNERANFRQGDQARRGFPQFVMSMGTGWQPGANQQRYQHIGTEVPTGVPPSSGERRP